MKDSASFYSKQTLFRIEAVTAEINQTVEHFYILCCEDHNKCVADEIVGTFRRILEGHSAIHESLMNLKHVLHCGSTNLMLFAQ